ncbi:MAG: MMPL family transporter, partial [Phycisphaerae bacterium]|nr:MMPL family transporter [Phycisphaerae bacterium]
MSVFHRRLLILVLGVIHHPKITLLIALLLVAGCSIFAKINLNVSTDQNKLFSADEPFFRDYLDFIDKFPENEAIYIVLQVKPGNAMPPVKRWTDAADAITKRLQGMQQDVISVDDRVPIDQLGTQGLLFDERDKIKQSIADARRFIPLAKLWGEKPNLGEQLLGATPIARFLGGVNLRAADAETAGFVGLLSQSLESTLRSTGPPTLPDLESLDATDPSRLGYYYVLNEQDHRQHQLLIRVYPNATHTSLTAISETVEAIRNAALDAGAAFPEFRVGTTGRPALEADEMRTTDTDSHHAEVVALIVVFIGMALMLRSMWLALVAEISLACGIAWTFGWATVSVGELNLLSIVFLIALIGIGMDYLVQILVRYRREARRYVRAEAIWIRVFSSVAAPINTACFGAAGAFLVSIFTHFPGTQQLGIIAGGGLLLCLISGYTVLPAILTLFPAKLEKVDAHQRYRRPPGYVHPLRRFIIPALWMAGVVAGVPFAQKVGFNPDLLGLQAQNLESVQLVNTLQTWYAVELSKDLSILRQVRDAVTNDPNVASTESILQAIDNQQWLNQSENQLPAINWTAPTPVPAGEIDSIAGRCRALADHFNSIPSGARAVSSLRSVANLLTAKTADHSAQAARLTEWQSAFVRELRGLLDKLHPEPLNASKLPKEMRGHYMSKDGTY